jgi:hypothetical protein
MEPDIASPIKKEKDSEIVKEVNADIAKFIVEVDALIKLYKIVSLNLIYNIFRHGPPLQLPHQPSFGVPYQIAHTLPAKVPTD